MEMKLIHSHWPKILFFASVLLLPLMLLAIFSNDYHVYDYYFNPDSLYLSTLYNGLFVQGYPLDSFNLNPSILLIPDVILYFPVLAITDDTIITSFIFSILQHTLIFVLMLSIFKQITGAGGWLPAAFASLMMMSFFMGSILLGDILFAAFSLVSTNHVGAFVMMLLAITLTLGYIGKPKKKYLFWIFVISMMSTFSDRLFILLYLLPVAVVLIFYFLKFKNKARQSLFLVVFVSAIAGILLQIFVDGRFIQLARSPEITSIDAVAPAFYLLMQHMGEYLKAMNIHSLIIILSMISWLTQTFMAARFIIKDELNSPLAFYVLFSVVATVIIFWMPVVTGTYIAKHILRYNIGAFYLSMLNLPLVIRYFISRSNSALKWLKTFGVMTTALFLMFFIISITHLSKRGIQNFFDYYPGFVRELDEIALQEELLCGVGHFWHAKPITTFSKAGIEVFHTWDNFIPYLHVNSRESFFGEDQIFNFAVINGFDDKNAYQKYLNHKGKLVRNGNTEVLILPPFKFDSTTGLPVFTGNSPHGSLAE
jgi:hypothetical protein